LASWTELFGAMGQSSLKPELSHENRNEWDPYTLWTFAFIMIRNIVRIDYTLACYVYRYMIGVVLCITPTIAMHVGPSGR
jgi:hypothetical protein